MPERRDNWRHDWREEAARKLADSKLSAAEREEISRELAGYLDDLCTDAPARGLDDSAADQIAATQSAAAELYEDKHLGANLYRARRENAMNLNDRTKQLWFPSIAMLLASIALLAIFQVPGLHPYYSTLFLHVGPPLHWRAILWRVYGRTNIFWLCFLPFLGAAGTYWSRRAGSARAMQAAVGLCPLLVFVAMFVAMLHSSFALDGVPPTNKLLTGLAVASLRWMIIPGAALLLGVLPFLRTRSAERRIA
ncbi:MAG TPA: hypothetical protein VNF00_00555 [Candidatus Acidoferrales bacterium]|nr:hypothetical protein [Candidatus Acidoferrales bacterium]